MDLPGSIFRYGLLMYSEFPVPEKLEHGVVFLGALILGFKNRSRKSSVSIDYFYVTSCSKTKWLKISIFNARVCGSSEKLFWSLLCSLMYHGYMQVKEEYVDLLTWSGLLHRFGVVLL